MEKQMRLSRSKSIIITLLFVMCSLSSDDIFSKNYWYNLNMLDYFYFYSGTCYYRENESTYQILSKDDFKYNSNGYQYIDDLIGEKTYVISGELDLLLVKESRVTDYNSFQDYVQDAVEWEEYVTKTPYMAGMPLYSSNGIDEIQISCKSYVESTQSGMYEYSAQNLSDLYFYGDQSDLDVYNSNSKPWVEGTDGDGSGSTIEITFSKDIDSFFILNGFVDFYRQNLFFDNNRLKTILVEDYEGNFSFNYTFEDRVEFSTIRLPNKINKVKLTIIDTYKGRKWDDTCISDIIVPYIPAILGESSKEDSVQFCL